MTKRDAADYITKDNKGAMSAPPDRVPRAATAAQMAQRRLKAPRGRLNSAVPSTGSPYTSAPSSFGQTGSGNNQFSTPFGNNTTTGASSFALSASFPPQQPSNRNFNPALPSGPFTFGASATSNPFANIGANLGNTGSNNINFGGFGVHTNAQTNPQSDADTMMESPQKKPQAFGAGFGTGSASTPSAAAFPFGQSSQSVAPSGFGVPATAQPSNDAFKYSQSLPAAQPGSTFGFAGQKSEEPKSQTSLFGQSTNNSQSGTNLFTRPASTAPSSSSLFSQRAPAFNPSSNLFGQTPATSLSPGNIFGGSVPATQPSNDGPLGTWFGKAPAAASSVADSHTSPEVSKPIFGLAPTRSHPSFLSPAAPATNPNRVMSNLAPGLTPMSSPPDSGGPVFSGDGGSKLFSGGSNSTFGDIFKPNANARLASADTSTTPTETSSAKSDPFTSKPTNSSMQTGFSSTARLLGTKPSESDTRGDLFGRVLRPEESAAPLGSTAESEQESSSRDDSTNTTSLIGKAPEAEPISRPLIEPNKAQETSSQFSTGSQHQSSTLQPLPSSTPSASNSTQSETQQAKQPPSSASKGSLFTRNLAPSSHDANSKPVDPQAKQPSWHAPNATASPVKTSLGSKITPSTSSKAPAAPQSFPSKSKGSASASSESDIRLRSYGSSAIPGYLDSDESVEHDSLSRLRNLNASFQKKVAKLDPAADDFEETVRHYIAQRTHIGHALNLKEREKAGMKRKMDNSEANEETLKGSKKARTEDFSSESTEARTPTIATANSSTSANIQPAKTATTQPTAQQTGLGGNIGLSTATSDLFKTTMTTSVPASSAFPSMPAASNPPRNPFASLTASTPSSSTVNPRAQPAAPDAGTVNGTAQYLNPFAALGANASIAPNSVSGSTSTTPFKPQAPSTTPTKSPPKKAAFEVPKFGASSGTSFMDAFAKKSAKSAADFEEEAKRKRKAEDFDSDEDDEAEWERKYEDEQRAKRNKLESLSQGGTTGFQPLFFNKDTSATAKKFFNLATDKVPDSSSAPEKTIPSAGSIDFTSVDTAENGVEGSLNIGDGESDGSRGSEEHGESASQEEDSDQATDEDDEEDVSDGDQDQDENHEEDEEEAYDDESEDEDIQAAMARSKSKRSLFDRIEPNPNLKPTDTTSNGARNAQQKPNGMSSYSSEAKATPNAPKASQAAVNSSFKSFGSNGVLSSGAFTSTPDAPTMSPFTPINGSGSDTKDPFAPAGSVFASSKKPDNESASIPKRADGEKFSFGSNTSVSAPTPARSVLFGANVSLGAGTIPGEGLFGSRPSTPSNDEPSRGSVFGNLGSGPNFLNSKGDNTYKQGTPIKFGTPNKDGPTLNVTAATPPAKDDAPAASKSFSNLFGPKPSKPGAEAFVNVGFNFGGPTHLTASPLLGASALSSAISSRATSPGATDTESVNTDTAEDHIEEPQASLMSTRPGEEDEDVLFEARSKALKLVREAEPNGDKPAVKFDTQGVGQLRVLKHKTTGKTRLLLRTEPGSNIVINMALIPSMTYRETGGKESGGVKFGIPTGMGIEQWVAKLKTPAEAKELAGILEANKGEGA